MVRMSSETGAGARIDKVLASIPVAMGPSLFGTESDEVLVEKFCEGIVPLVVHSDAVNQICKGEGFCDGFSDMWKELDDICR